MLSKFFFTALAIFSLSVAAFNAAIAEDGSATCVQLDAKASGDMAKYSLHGEANGPVFFSGIRCAIKHRNKVLCAMEMISFDATAKVYDYYTAEEVEISKGYFCLDEKNTNEPIAAFGSKVGAEKFMAEKEGRIILDYSGLTERKLK